MNISDYSFDIVIIAGQSNAQGNGRGGQMLDIDENVFELNDANPVKVYDSPVYVGKTVMELVIPIQMLFEKAHEHFDGKEYCADFATTFANDYIQSGMLQGGRKLLIIKGAVGGTGFAKQQWGVGNVLSDRLQQMVNYALSANSQNKVVALLWHQGEHDAYENAHFNSAQRYEFYVKMFSDQIKLLRDNFGNMPVICGGFVDDWASKFQEQCDTVESALKDSCVTLGNASFVSSDGLLSNDQAVGNGDDIHFCRDSVYELGNRYFNAYKVLTE